MQHGSQRSMLPFKRKPSSSASVACDGCAGGRALPEARLPLPRSPSWHDALMRLLVVRARRRAGKANRSVFIRHVSVLPQNPTLSCFARPAARRSTPRRSRNRAAGLGERAVPQVRDWWPSTVMVLAR